MYWTVETVGIVGAGRTCATWTTVRHHGLTAVTENEGCCMCMYMTAGVLCRLTKLEGRGDGCVQERKEKKHTTTTTSKFLRRAEDAQARDEYLRFLDTREVHSHAESKDVSLRGRQEPPPPRRMGRNDAFFPPPSQSSPTTVSPPVFVSGVFVMRITCFGCWRGGVSARIAGARGTHNAAQLKAPQQRGIYRGARVDSYFCAPDGEKTVKDDMFCRVRGELHP